MEYRISDLLDDIPEVTINIQPKVSASPERIKELTMKKIHNEKKNTRRGIGAIGKAILIAAMIAALAIPVAAAGGFQLTGWLEGIFNPRSQDYEKDQVIGSVSKSWDVSGWVVNLAAKEPTAEGLILVCDQWGNEAVEKSGSLNVDDHFWLEVWKDGSYVKLAEMDIPVGELVPVKADAITEYPISWADSYGTLEPGSYRLGKNFTYIAEDGKQEIVPLYAKFRVFDQDMGAVVKEHQDMLETLRTSENYHLKTVQHNDHEDYELLVSEYWKHGKDWLREFRYVREDGSLWARRGSLYRDGKGYSLEWSGDSVNSPLSAWESADWLSDMNLEMWTMGFEIYDMSVGEVTGMENTTTFFLGSTGMTGEVYYHVISMTADDSGLKEGYTGFTDDKTYTKESLRELITIEVFDTSAEEIAKVLEAQNVTDPVSFSWEEDQAKYLGDKTEGFANTESKPIANGEEAIERAKNECTLEYQNKATVAYDKEANMWRVELGYSQDRTAKQIVYLTADGITKLVVLPKNE